MMRWRLLHSGRWRAAIEAALGAAGGVCAGMSGSCDVAIFDAETWSLDNLNKSTRELARQAADCGASAVIVMIVDSGDDIESVAKAAMIAPLARALAPKTRVSAVNASAHADPRAVADAVVFLAQAGSTTGQTLHVAPRQ